jgi:peptidoglycan hydrolase-like protein with peptidoglycan-binding domain
MKAKMSLIQKHLNTIGYSLEVNGQKDKPTTKAIMDFQKKHGLAQNSVVCEKTFNLMNIKDDVL